MNVRAILGAIIFALILLAPVSGAEGAKYIEIVEFKQLEGATGWRLVQLQNGWAIYDHPGTSGSINFIQWMLAVKADSIPGRLAEGGLLMYQVGIEAKLGRLPDIRTKTTRGFDVTMRRYVVLRQQREGKHQ